MHELTVSRHIAAPPEKVWRVMTERQTEWWCPRPWKTEIIQQDRRAGGRCSMVMKGPDGEVSPQEGVYLAWDEGRRFASTDAMSIDPATGELQPAEPFMIGIWEIAPEGTGTRYTARARHWTAEACRQHEDMGFTQGWGICADQLAALCEAG